jgi:predicted ATPase
MTEHPYQLRRIELQDFKSVAQASVDLKPLTVVVGANSSGKSTLLQSILAVAQAVRSDTSSAEFPLNGEFVRLGTFEETRNFLSEQAEQPMQVAFDLVEGSRRPRFRRAARARTRDTRRRRFTWRAHLNSTGVDGAASSGFARVVALQIEVSALSLDEVAEPELRLTCDLTEFGDPINEPLRTEAAWASGGVTHSRPWLGPAHASATAIQASGRITDWTSGQSASIDAVALAGGLPAALLRRQTRFDLLADLWWVVATSFLEDEILDQRQRVLDTEAPPKRSFKATKVAATDIASLMEPNDDEPIDFRSGSQSLREALMLQLGSLRASDRREVAKSLARLDPAQFRSRLRKQLGDASWVDEILYVGPPGESGDLLWECGQVSQRFFADAVRYLGPLREAPHVLYDPGPSKLDLGIAGEYSAAVLHAQANTRVLMPTPHGDGERQLLGDALDFWLREFELADNARSEDRGRIGIGLSVTPKGINREVDLTSVGVGVSQVLPVVLLCLLAEPGSLVILEQPELHLHPRLQQKVAEFLLACTRAGRQLVVETHSEHLVNHLRYQIAKDETDETHGLIGLVFAENEAGITSYREPAINPYGGLSEDWPTGFLDLTAKESQELVRQSIAKRERDESASAG